ncbi:50S ribosome-binding GTPase [Helicobacter pylori]|nr:50S ribosome-binding GTPase [Helicobacter pylori]
MKNETLEQFKRNQKRNQEILKKLLDFVHAGEKYGIKVEESLKDKIRNAMENVAGQKLKVALVGGFSEGKTSIAAAWIERLDKESMKIDHKESSDEVKIYNIDNEIELVDTPGLFGFKVKEHDSGKIERYKDITKKYVSEAHLILYALNPSNPIKESHKDDLNWLFRTLNLLSRTIFVISRFDEEADIEDEKDYNKRFEIKKENIQSRLNDLISLSEEEKESLIIVAVAANPFDLGVEHWLKHQEEFQKLSHIKALQDATQKKIKENGGRLTIIEEAKKSVIQDVVYRQMPPAKQALQDINREMEYLNKTLEKRRKDIQDLNKEISGRIGIDLLSQSGFINATNIKVARDGIVAGGKFVGVDLALKFKPWGAVKLASNLNKALPLIGLAFEAWDSYNKYQKQQEFEKAKEKMKSNFDGQKQEILALINDETRFKQTCFPSVFELEKCIQACEESVKKTQECAQGLGKWIQTGEDFIKGEDFIDVEPEEE